MKNSETQDSVLFFFLNAEIVLLSEAIKIPFPIVLIKHADLCVSIHINIFLLSLYIKKNHCHK